MATNVEIPALGESVGEATLIRWHKNDGDEVEQDEPICELETDKANVDLPAPASGILRRVKEEGDTVQVGEAIARIDEAGAGAGAGADKKQKQQEADERKARRDANGGQPRESEAPRRQRARASASARPEDYTPAVRRLVEEHDVDPSKISGTGRGGRVTKSDVLEHLDQARGEAAPVEPDESDEDETRRPAPSAPASESAETIQVADRPQPAGSRAGAGAGTGAGAGGFDAEGVRRVPMSKIRRRIAERLVTAQQTAAILTTFNEVDLHEVLEIRKRYKESFEQRHGVSLGLMSFFARACVLALREYPHINAQIDGDNIVYHQHVHLGIAVSTDRGLAVPVLRNAEEMSFARIESEIKRLAHATREGKLGLNELTGGTFTITNGGVFGSLLSTPILNPPQSGILGMHTIQKRPVVIDDQITIRPMMYIALSYDHRLVDGRESVSFLVRLKQYLEDPARLMLEI